MWMEVNINFPNIFRWKTILLYISQTKGVQNVFLESNSALGHPINSRGDNNTQSKR